VCEYSTLDKSEWGDGAWQDEPDKVQWTDEETGFPCLAVRNRLGAWCGYVGVDASHRCYEKDYDDVEVRVHGGLFAAKCDEGPEESSICHVPEPGQPDNVWWLGFDCGHAQDLIPEMRARYRQLSAETGVSLFNDPQGEEYRTLDYVRAEVRSLAGQLADQR
jgi:hypothetical protein